MTKPPIRVVAQPPSRFSSQSQHYPASSAAASTIPLNTSQCMVSSQPKLSMYTVPTISVPPMANSREVDRRQAMRAHSGTDAVHKINMIRRDLAEEEGELRRLSELENETRNLSKRNGEKEAELSHLSAELREQQNILRTAAGRVEILRRQIEELYRRRQAAAAAALSEQRKMQQQAVRLQETTRSAAIVERPRASVEPFQVNVPIQRDPEPDTKEDKCTVVDVSLDSEDSSKPIPSPPSEPVEIAPFLPKYPPPSINDPGSSNRSDASPSPPKDPHPTAGELQTSTAEAPEKPMRMRELVRQQEFSISSFADSLDESRLRSGKTDLVSIRTDSLKAAKRRSWAASEGTTLSEADTIRRILEEQRRGRNHFIPELPTPHEEPKMEVDRRTVKGILRPLGLKKERRRIEFDPLALMLDAALEGELDLVKSSAAKLSDVSVANDEGITALHNAICAGHYEIVKFLIEADADVNAQDSDGWTPLHCAASCNNLPMVRQLVEGGACVLASTLSDMETPVEKCEEDEEGYDGCLRYLTTAHNATGAINNGTVYAAYDYDAQFDDELSFKAGDELRVISKDDKEKNWWTCERVGHDGETGLVPRTYVALYPALRYRKRCEKLFFLLLIVFLMV
ncbi:SH3 domain protein [Necator americanus]|uniref:SH3 domain protein n=1 Tax=Necator americanus TaxID=51031 RepID=W2SQG4_NECAM|nr:SH3 domain protein [Necator americanus]ETN70932.1 SH3 domain protein [Necator americanus]